MKHGRYRAFDALRGVAAIAVLLHHAERELHLPELFAYGYLAVDFFFLMSGFVIAAAYEERMRSGLSFLAFGRVRLIRLWPMMALGACLGVAASLASGMPQGDAWWGGLSALIMIPLLWHAAVLFPVNVPEWSIFFELATNFLHHAVARALTVPVLIVIIALSFAALLLAGWQLHGLANGYSPETFWGGFPRTFLSYFGGVLLYRTRDAWQPRLPSVPFVVLVCVFPAVVLMAKAATMVIPASAYFLGAVLFLNPALLMMLAASNPGERATPFCETMGALSYPLYALHVPLLIFAVPYVVPLDLSGRYAAAALTCAVIVAVALGTQYRALPVRRARA